MRKVLIIFVLVAGLSVAAGYYYTKRTPGGLGSKDPKVAASLESVQKSEETAKTLSGLKFDNDEDVATLNAAIASIPTTDHIKEITAQ